MAYANQSFYTMVKLTSCNNLNMQLSNIIIVAAVAIALLAGIWLSMQDLQREGLMVDEVPSEPESGSLLDTMNDAEDAAAMMEASGSVDIDAVMTE